MLFVADVMAWMKDVYELPHDLAIDPDLRTAYAALVAEHLARSEPLIRSWTRQAVESSPDVHGTVVDRRVYARIFNAMAWWSLDGSDEDDEILLPSILHAGNCRDLSGTPILARRALLVQSLPAAKRDAAVEAERRRLKRWGQPNPDLAARPVPSLSEQESKFVSRIKAQQPIPGPALPPMLASRLLVTEEPVEDWGGRCALHQWGLAQVLAADGSRRAEAMNAYRYAMMPEATAWDKDEAVTVERGSALAANGYPAFARRFEVEGTVTVQTTCDMEGRFVGATVIDRKVRVDRVPERAIAFETVFDAASVARAATWACPRPSPSAASSPGGVVKAERKIVWSLE